MICIKVKKYRLQFKIIIKLKYIILRQSNIYGFSSIQYAGVKLWNSLAVNCKTCNNINAFRRCLDNWKCVNEKYVKCLVFLYHVEF